MSKANILNRVSMLAKANIHAMLDKAENPQKMLDQMVRDYTNNIHEAEKAVAQTIGQMRMQQDDLNKAHQDSKTWAEKAIAASNAAEKSRANGDHDIAQKFDNMAKMALQRQIDSENTVNTMQPQVEQNEYTIEQLKNGIVMMKNKYADLKIQRDQMVQRANMAKVQSNVNKSIGSLNMSDPTSELSRFEDKISRKEALVRGQNELAASTMNASNQFEDLGESSEIEARFAALKAGSPYALTANKDSNENTGPDTVEDAQIVEE